MLTWWQSSAKKFRTKYWSRHSVISASNSLPEYESLPWYGALTLTGGRESGPTYQYMRRERGTATTLGLFLPRENLRPEQRGLSLAGALSYSMYRIPATNNFRTISHVLTAVNYRSTQPVNDSFSILYADSKTLDAAAPLAWQGCHITSDGPALPDVMWRDVTAFPCCDVTHLLLPTTLSSRRLFFRWRSTRFPRSEVTAEIWKKYMSMGVKAMFRDRRRCTG